MVQLQGFGIGELRVWGIRSVRAMRTNTTLLEGTIRLEVDMQGFRT